LYEEEPGVASSKHEKQLARMRAERQAARRAAEIARRKRRRTVLASTLAVLAVVAVAALLVVKTRGGDDKPDNLTAGATPTPSTSGAPAAVNGCTFTPGGEAAKKVATPAAEDVVTTGMTTATLDTSQGKVVLSLDSAKAPCAVGSFRSLVRQKYFDGTPCHRLTTAGLFVLQCGDPSGTGSGGPGYAFGDENLEGATYKKGTVAMANSGPGTNGSQFFLVYKDTQLGPQYTPFGTITAGLDVLDKIAKGGSTPAGDGKPKLPVTITNATLTPAP
jgi:peptidyl-prolyl cis-trans isomerase B (cyclophilin B)